MNFELRIKNKSFTLIEVLVGTFLFLIVFSGIFGAYQLGLKVVGQSKNKITATAIANGEIEKIRNLSYEKVGTLGANLPNASGTLEAVTSTTVNGVEYKIERKIVYISDPADGAGSDDSCNLDYKRIEIKVSWSGRFPGEVKLGTDIAPKDKVQEIQSCTAQPGGILSVLVFDAYGNSVSGPLIEIKNPQTFETLASATPSSGEYDFPLASSTYKVVVSKGTDYTVDQTYGTNEIAIPEKQNPTVLEGQQTNISFQIDRVSSFAVYTLSTWGQEFFSDTFSDESKISEKSNISILNGEANLATTTEGYYSSGYLISSPISPQSLISWQDFSFSDSEPEGTDLKYQIFYASGTEWVLIPDSDLPGNSMGFDVSPVDLSNLATTTYSSLKLKANFSTNSTSSTPTLFDWQLSWKTSNPTPIPNATFSVHGEKLIGKDAQENPVYKFSTTTQTDSNGKKDLLNWEWDNYTFSIPTSTNLDLASSDPPNPVSLAPTENKIVKLYLDSENSLLVTVEDSSTLEPIFSAQVRLYKTGYEKIQYTDSKGQTYFIPLDSGTYNLEISAPGYSTTTDSASISGDITKLIKLTPSE
jgi:hypothetical protein